VVLGKVSSQGLKCDKPSDCTDEYNPYCSKWGYCTWTPKFGDTGPPQSRGAVEDGRRGQCRDDSDCTRWAPSCSPLGYFRGGVQDGSFGAPTNPKKGGKPSDWIKKNAKSGAARNEEYYGKIEDDNRRNHENFREKYPVLFPEKVFGKDLVRLRSIEEENYSHCTYCKYDPKTEKSGGSARRTGNKPGNQRKNGANANSKNKGGSKRGSTRGQNHQSRSSTQGRKGAGSGRKQNFREEIKAGRIPGKAGKDYPNYSLATLKDKGFTGIKPAREELIPKNYPRNRQNNSPGARNGNRRNGGGNTSGGDCPGSLDECMDACPSEMRVYISCVSSCGRRCAKK